MSVCSEDEDMLGDDDDVLVLQRVFRDWAAIHFGSIFAAKIADLPRAVDAQQFGVPSRGEPFQWEDDLAFGIAADHHGALGQWIYSIMEGAEKDAELSH